MLGIDPAASLLLTDLYELNMYAAYLEAGMTDTAVFEFFVRKLPRERNFLLAAGLEQVLQFLEQARFTEAELAWLETSGRFDARTLASLAAFRFTGEVYALPEGTAVFPDEPILGIEAPLPEAQLLESRLINLLHFQTLIASKAARMVLAAPGKLLLDFGLRRAHGAEAGLLAARAAYLAGFAGTATMLAEPLFGVPVIRHHGAFLHPGARGRDPGVRTLRPGSARAGHPPAGYLRHRGSGKEGRGSGAQARRATASWCAAFGSTAAISPIMRAGSAPSSTMAG